MRNITVSLHSGELHPLYQFNRPLMVIRSRFLLLLLLITAVVWIRQTLMRPDVLPIQSVRVEGAFQQLAPDRLEAIVTDTVRGGFFNVNVEVIQKVLLQDPWMRAVTVSRNWPDSLTVRVVEQTAVAIWADQGLINSEGLVFEPESYTYPEGLPVLRGPAGTVGEMLKHYREFSEILARGGLIISGLSLNDRRSWVVDLSGGPHLVLGRINFRNRLERFVNYTKWGSKEEYEKMDTVDLRYTNGFAVKWKVNMHHSELEQDHHG